MRCMRTQSPHTWPWLMCTDPPYYDNVPYGDLSDFFYIWLRKSLGTIYPELLSTILVPKERELIAEPFRHGGKICGGQPVFKGTRVTLRTVLASLAEGDTPETILAAFPTLSPEDVRAAIAFAAASAEEDLPVPAAPRL